jgi:hypothetical protein
MSRWGGEVRSRVPKMTHHAPLANRAVRGEQTLARGLAVAAFFFDGEGERLVDFLGILSRGGEVLCRLFGFGG